MDIHWFIPLHGDGRLLGTAETARPTSLDYLGQVARAADTLGYAGALVPIGRSCEDAWVAASALIPLTQRLKFIIAVRPGSLSPTLAARMAATFDRLSLGRVAINAVSGGDPVDLAGDGIFLEHDERYACTDEFLQVWKRLVAGERVSFQGSHVRVEDASLLFPPLSSTPPAVYFGGSSSAAIEVAARQADVYLSFGEPVEQLREKITAVRSAAALHGRTVRFGIRFHVIVRETDTEARAAADQLISRVTPETVGKAQRVLARYESVGQERMVSLHGGDRSRLWLGPNLWAGIGLLRGYAGTALVGDPESVAALIREYQEAGVDTFILSGYPHLEEAYRVAELLFPKLGYAPNSCTPGGEVLAHHLQR